MELNVFKAFEELARWEGIPPLLESWKTREQFVRLLIIYGHASGGGSPHAPRRGGGRRGGGEGERGRQGAGECERVIPPLSLPPPRHPPPRRREGGRGAGEARGVRVPVRKGNPPSHLPPPPVAPTAAHAAASVPRTAPKLVYGE